MVNALVDQYFFKQPATSISNSENDWYQKFWLLIFTMSILLCSTSFTTTHASRQCSTMFFLSAAHFSILIVIYRWYILLYICSTYIYIYIANLAPEQLFWTLFVYWNVFFSIARLDNTVTFWSHGKTNIWFMCWTSYIKLFQRSVWMLDVSSTWFWLWGVFRISQALVYEGEGRDHPSN